MATEAGTISLSPEAGEPGCNNLISMVPRTRSRGLPELS